MNDNPRSRRTWTESLASMYGIVKCFPTSRSQSMRRTSPSQSRLSTIRAPRVPEKSRNRSSCERLAIQEVPFRGAARRVADHPRTAPDESHGASTVPLELEEAEDRDEVARV